MTRRLLTALVGLVVLTAGLVASVGSRGARDVERRSAVAGLQRDALELVIVGRNELAGPLGGPAQARLLRSAERIASEAGTIAAIVDARGEPVATSRAGLPDAFRNPDRARTGSPDRRVAATDLTTTREAGLEIVRAPVVVGGEVLGTVIVSRSLASIDAAVAQRVGSERWVFLLMIVLAAGVAWLLGRSWTRHLGAVSDAMRRMPVESEAPRVVEPAGPPELRALGTAYLAVAGDVRALRVARDTVASDVAHQLRTPLTTVGLRIEQLRASVEAGDEPGTRRNAEIADREVARLRQVVDGLLALRGGSASALQRSEVDVAEVARERAEVWADLAAERGLRIAVDAPASAPALAATRAVGQSLDNLIDNAFEVAPPGSTVRVTVATERRQVVATVRDHGPGMSPVERAHAFDRFWRGANGSARGLGIGLPIVADLMAASEGHAEIREAPGGGVLAVLTFEASRRPAATGADQRPAWGGPRVPAAHAPRPMRVRLASGLLVSTGIVLVGTAAAATNALPPSIQHTAAGVLSRFGVSVPDPGSRGPSTGSDPAGPSDSSRGHAGTVGSGASRHGSSAGSSGPAGQGPAGSGPATTGTDATGGSTAVPGADPAPTGAVQTPAATAPGQANQPATPPGQANKPATPPGQAKKTTPPPGQANKPVTPPGQAKKTTPPPGQAKKTTPPPGQAKKTTTTT